MSVDLQAAAVAVSRPSASRSWNRSLPLFVGTAATIAAFGQLGHRLPTPDLEDIAEVRAMRMVGQSQWLIPINAVSAVMAYGQPWNLLESTRHAPRVVGPELVIGQGFVAQPGGASDARERVRDAADDVLAAIDGWALQVSNASRTIVQRPAPTAKADAARPAERRATITPAGREQAAVTEHIAKVYRVESEDIGRYVALAWTNARELQIDPALLLAIMATESSFNAKAQSPVGAQGLMQVHTRVHRDKLVPHGGVDRVFDPAVNIHVGSRILKGYLDRYGNSEVALKAYVGAALLNDDGGYASKVLSRRAEFRAVMQGAGQGAGQVAAAATRRDATRAAAADAGADRAARTGPVSVADASESREGRAGL